MSLFGFMLFHVGYIIYGLVVNQNGNIYVCLQFASLETPGYVGFANLPIQVHRKSVKKGFEFTLMVVGESGLGKSTLVNSLFLTDLYPERVVPDAVGKL
jgi:polynucleotide 5'-kinase involved in rRNA processing